MTLRSFFLSFFLFAALGFAAEAFSPQDVLDLVYPVEAVLSPDGEYLAYATAVNRKPNEPAGAAYRELYVILLRTGEIKPFVTGRVNVSSVQWSPDGRLISFLDKRGEKNTQVWAIPVDGGEARQLTFADANVRAYRWRHKSRELAYVAETPETKKEKQLKEKGYDFIFFEENLKDRNLYLITAGEKGEPRQLTEGINVWDFEFSPDGATIAVAASPRNLVDDSYMFKRIYLIDVATGDRRLLYDPQSKLGNLSFSPDGKKLAFSAALSQSDHAVSQAFVIDIAGGNPVNLTPKNFRGHVEQVYWQDDKTVLFTAAEGVWTTLSAVAAAGGPRRIVYDAQKTGVVFTDISVGRNKAVLIGSTPTCAGDVFLFDYKKGLKQMTDLNPWLKERQLGEQIVVRYPARDGVEIEGLLLYPVGYRSGERYPLVVVVHGGPEANFINGFTQLTRYFIAGQVLANRGYFVFYPNYRAGTGYGVEFAAAGYGDAAGVEFDDIADGIDWLAAQGLVDPERVGLGGGSYGGYAAAWFASYYTAKVRAVCMFVGISDLISKRLTTDIPYEELYVHSGRPLEEMWEFSLKRSP
ncbi:MAG: prolyl oligopeptidase family serine peptidase, partial [candidate division KSB1 bacterium]|nr:prolyl oligopeptidase family serine peptidase [candidate division KSB1 bacterium]